MFADEEKDVEEQPSEDPAEEETSEEDDSATVVMSGRHVQEALAADIAEEADEPDPAPEEPAPASMDEGWKTAKVPAAQPAAKPEPQPAAKPAEAAAAKETPAKAAPDMPVESKPSGNFLARLGIEDEKTQRWVLIGGIVVLALCCICACVAIVIGFMSSGSGSFY